MPDPDTHATRHTQSSSAASKPASSSPAEPSPMKSAWATIVKLGPASWLALGALVLPPLGSIVLFAYLKTIGTWLKEQGATGISAYIVAFILFAGLALLPTYSTAIVGGWAFGLKVGIPAALAGFTGGSLLAYAICKPTAAERVEKVIQEHPRWAQVRTALIGGSTLKTLAIVSLVRLPPNSPFAMTNLVLASTRVRLWIFVLGTLVGMAPRTIIAVWIGSNIQQQLEEGADKKPLWLIIGGIVLSLLVLGIIGLIAKRSLAHMVSQTPANAPGLSTPQA
ncbi:MAG: TVP38/TMEM64 family protein [Phycisphaerales bacterium]